jgi:hypothetical protein
MQEPMAVQMPFCVHSFIVLQDAFGVHEPVQAPLTQA